MQIKIKYNIATYKLHVYETSTKEPQLIYSWKYANITFQNRALQILKICPPNITLLQKALQILKIIFL